jgi:hypothetical protein
MNYSKLRQEVLCALRGKFSQSIVSKRLGFNFNQVYRWENSRTKMSWLDFVDFAETCRRDLHRPFHHTLGYKGSIRNSQALIQFLFGTDSATKIANKSGRPQRLTRNWMSGKSIPSFEDILEFIDRFQICLPEVVGTLTDISQIPSLKSVYEKLKLQKDLIYQYPQADALLAALLTEEYQALPKHQSGVLARFCGLSMNEEIQVLTAMEQVGLVMRENELFKPSHTPIDTQGNYRGSIQLRKYWAKRFLAFLDHFHPPQPRSLTGYYLFALSDEAEKEINQAYYDFLAKAKTLFTSDTGSRKRVKLVSAQVLDLEESTAMIKEHRLMHLIPKAVKKSRTKIVLKKARKKRKPPLQLEGIRKHRPLPECSKLEYSALRYIGRLPRAQIGSS